MSGTFQGRVAFASIKFVAGVPTFRLQSGDFGPTITNPAGNGNFQLDIASPIDPDEACISLAVRGASGAAHVVSWTDTAITVQVSDLAGVGTDIDCDLSILVKPAN